MAWDGSGTFTRTDGSHTGATTWQIADAAGDDIFATTHDTHDQDLATGIQACLTKNNESKPTADFKPNADATYAFGSQTARWTNLWLSGSVKVVASGSVGTLSWTPTAARTLTLPDATDTLVGKATTDTLTNKTLSASVAAGTWTASGTWTLPALTLGGTVSGGGQQLNNVIIGASTPLAGTFTTLIASGATTINGNFIASEQTNLNPVNKLVSIGPSGASGVLTIAPAAGATGTINNVVIGGTTPLAGTFTALTATGNVALGDASGDTLTIAPNAVTWSNNPTHSGNHTFSGTITATSFTAATTTLSSAALELTAAATLTINASNAGGSIALRVGGTDRLTISSAGVVAVTGNLTVSGTASNSVGGATASSSTALIFPAGTTAISSLRLPHGSAPTSPVDGDTWTTTAGMFVRINGATVGPLS